MSQRNKIESNPNDSRATRLEIAKEFGGYRYSRDSLAHLSRYGAICDYLISQKALSIIDIGCGDIYTLKILDTTYNLFKTKDHVARYVAFDIDAKALDQASRGLNAGPNSITERVQGDITCGDLGQFFDKEFDLVICTEVIEHLQPKFVPGLLSEISRIGRSAFISTPNFDGGTGKIPKDHVKEWTYKELSAELAAAGIKVEREFGTFCNLAKVQKLCRQYEGLGRLYDRLDGTMGRNLLSVTMARLIRPEQAQNIMRFCKM
jgi:2-polyprenyl-3-methyl-5-hydroxy-6-metoxy-1,4-benzoquinol methylase